MYMVLFPRPLEWRHTAKPPGGFSSQRAKTAWTPVPPRTPSCHKLSFQAQWLLPKPHRHTDSLFITCLKTASRPANPLIHNMRTLLGEKGLEYLNFSVQRPKKIQDADLLMDENKAHLSVRTASCLPVKAAFQSARLSFLLIHLDLHIRTHILTLCHSLCSNSEVKLSTVPSSLFPQWYCSPRGWGCLPGWLPPPQAQLRLSARNFCYSIPWWCAFPSVRLHVCLPPCLPAWQPVLLLSLRLWCVCASVFSLSVFVSWQQRRQAVPSQDLTEQPRPGKGTDTSMDLP